MMERKYSVSEIDRMRASVVRRMITAGPVVLGQIEGEDDLIPMATQRYASDSAVEDRLRTYMLAGVEPEDLEAKPTVPAITKETT